jgi:hypothetical protein
MMVINPHVSCADQKSTDSHFLSVVYSYLQLLYLTLGFYLYVCFCACMQFICLLRKTSLVDTPVYVTHLIVANEL